jgi:NADH-quinone oxidoreductase subunit F
MSGVMCGEETGLLNAMEGERVLRHARPPFPRVSGFWGKPTVVNNVETLWDVPYIVTHGDDWYKGLSRSEDGGMKIYGVSRKVKLPGALERLVFP